MIATDIDDVAREELVRRLTAYVEQSGGLIPRIYAESVVDESFRQYNTFDRTMSRIDAMLLNP